MTVARNTSKGKRDRTYPLGNLLPILRVWHDGPEPAPGPKDHVLPWTGDRSPLDTDWRQIQEHAGLTDERRYRLKDCRSTAASEMLLTEGTIVVARWLGHSAVVLVRWYANDARAKE